MLLRPWYIILILRPHQPPSQEAIMIQGSWHRAKKLGKEVTNSEMEDRPWTIVGEVHRGRL